MIDGHPSSLKLFSSLTCGLKMASGGELANTSVELLKPDSKNQKVKTVVIQTKVGGIPITAAIL